MMGPMKGHMALNSSPYKTSVNKLSSQHLIEGQMKGHYHNLATVKSAVDHHPPKSIRQSIKKRDQVKRDVMLYQTQTMGWSKRPMTSRSETMDRSNIGRSGQHSKSEPRLSPRSDPFMETYNDTYYSQTSRSWSPNQLNLKSRPSTAKSRLETKSNGKKNSTMQPPRQHVMTLTYNGDYLEKHEERFNKSDKPFTPRTKKRPGKSVLAQSRHYSAPTVPKPKNKEKKKEDKSGEDMEKKLMELNQSENYDDEHLKWIEKQAEFTKKLALLEESGRRDKDWMKIRSFGIGSNPPPSEGCSETMQRIKMEEEELKYCEFINDVTNDILIKGIYSDTVLNQLIDRHLNTNHGLDRAKLERMLRQLKVDLGISTKSDSPRLTAKFTSNKKLSGYGDDTSFSDQNYKKREENQSIKTKTSNSNLSRFDSISSIRSESHKNIDDQVDSTPGVTSETSLEDLKREIDLLEKDSEKDLSVTLKQQNSEENLEITIKPEENGPDGLEKHEVEKNDESSKQNSTGESDYESVVALNTVLHSAVVENNSDDDF